jgi:hypothetical protein
LTVTALLRSHARWLASRPFPRSLNLLHRSDQGVCEVRAFRVSGNKVHSEEGPVTWLFQQVTGPFRVSG